MHDNNSILVAGSAAGDVSHDGPQQTRLAGRAAFLTARFEAIPFTPWHRRARIIMGCAQCSCLAAEKPFGEVCSVPQIEVTDLRAVDTDEAKEMTLRNVKAACLARRHDYLTDLRQRLAGRLEQTEIGGWQSFDWVDDHGRC